MRNLRLDLCYDGTRYRGWQRLNGEENTIQGKLEQTLSRILGEPVEISGSGRTDAGVHAQGPGGLVPLRKSHALRGNPAPAAAVSSGGHRHIFLSGGAPRFHARLNAKKKTYCYRIWNSDSPCVFDRRYMTVLVEPLDLDAMKAASKALLGQHDFTCFCTRAPKKKSTVREIFDISITRTDAEVDISVTADGFLYNMMRILIGTLVEVGLGRRRADSIPDLFIQKRAEAGTLMPAKGLCLMEVVY